MKKSLRCTCSQKKVSPHDGPPANLPNLGCRWSYKTCKKPLAHPFSIPWQDVIMWINFFLRIPLLPITPSKIEIYLKSKTDPKWCYPTTEAETQYIFATSANMLALIYIPQSFYLTELSNHGLRVQSKIPMKSNGNTLTSIKIKALAINRVHFKKTIKRAFVLIPPLNKKGIKQNNP